MNPSECKADLVMAPCLGLFLCLAVVLPPAWAQTGTEPGSRWQRLRQVQEAQRENRQAVVSQESLGAVTANIREDSFGGREMLLYVPSALPPAGDRKSVV